MYTTAIGTATASIRTTLALACASLALVSGRAEAQGHGARGGGHGYSSGGHGQLGDGYYAPRHGGGYYAPHHGGGWRRGGSGWVWGGIGLGLGIGLASVYASPWYYDEPRYLVVNPPTVVYENVPQPAYSQPVPARSSQPVIYPRDGQSAAKLDADANACSAWAGQQPNATTDSSVFLRGTQACMDARGYTVR